MDGRSAEHAGRITLAIPKLRRGSYFPNFLQPRRTAEKALATVIRQACVHGASTRSVDDLVKAMGAGAMSSSQVSRLCADIDVRVSALLQRPLEGAWRYLRLDATSIEVCDGGRPPAKPAPPCKREPRSHGGRWRQRGRQARSAGRAHRPFRGQGVSRTEFLRSLAARGPRGVKLVIAGDHKGLRAAVAATRTTIFARGGARPRPSSSGTRSPTR